MLRKRSWLLVPAALAVLSFAAACGGDDDAAPVAAGATAAPGVPEIDQDRLKFIPNELTVHAGTAITFKNSETAVHTVTIAGKNVSGLMKKGEEFLWTPPSTGSFRVTCDYHPQMRATITVID